MAVFRTIILITVLLLGWVALRNEAAAHDAVPAVVVQLAP